MRIGDWSSDVCSSDLEVDAPGGAVGDQAGRRHVVTGELQDAGLLVEYLADLAEHGMFARRHLRQVETGRPVEHQPDDRSEERRAGNECVRPWSTWWLP